MAAEKEKTEQIIKKIESDKIELVELHFSDLHGFLKSVTIPAEKAGEPKTLREKTFILFM